MRIPGSTPHIRATRSACRPAQFTSRPARSEEHTSELQSQSNLVCRLLLEKKKTILSTPTASDYPLSSYAPSSRLHVLSQLPYISFFPGIRHGCNLNSDSPLIYLQRSCSLS